MTRRRLDAELVRRSLAASRGEAREAVEAGMVQIEGVIAEKPATMVADDAAIVLVGDARPFVSRAGGKLAAALDRFGIYVADRRCLDVGASTGGFTDVLLQRGAATVIAVDVGYGQLAFSLRSDPRVHVLERTNIRELDPAALPYAADLVVADLSFISLRTVLPTLQRMAAPDATFVVLVKPQFEAGRAAIGKGGVVRDPAIWARVLEDVVAAAASVGLGASSAMASPIRGPAGNVEFLLMLEPGSGRAPDLAAAVREGEGART